MELIIYLNLIISILFTLCYFYQFIYVLVGLRNKSVELKAKDNHRYAVIISARNESTVIGNLIDSINAQNYPTELIDIFVVADNCTDNTAEVARNAGAFVYERFNNQQIGKGYALDWLFKQIEKNHSDENYEAFIVFDADNVLDKNFISEMNNLFDNGYNVLTSYRNSKNYGDNWLTAGYSLWFLREAKYLNNARMQLGTSCAISGTGFLLSADIIKRNNGWIHHLLTEDIEFTTDCIIQGEKIGYCQKAMLYDEQPTKFSQSYVQRLRWAKGFYQVFKNYGVKLIRGIFKKSFSCYDMLMTLMPAMLLTLISSALNIIAIPVGILGQFSQLPQLIETLVRTLLSFYTMFFVLGLITTITEWKQIHCQKAKKILYLFTFPVFMLTYVPISVVALFTKVEWKPINHSHSITLEEICEEDSPVR